MPTAWEGLEKPTPKAGKTPDAVITLQKRRLLIEFIASVPVLLSRVM